MYKILRINGLLLGILLMAASTAQAGRGNPFELNDRLPPVEVEEVATDQSPQEEAESDNPFNVRYRSTDEDFEREDLLLVARGERKAVLDARGKLLGIHLFLLIFLGVFWSLMRPTLTACYKSLFNSNVAWQLYRRKAGGLRSRLLLAYLFSFLSIGFFLYLLTQHFDWLPGDHPWVHWGLLSLGATAFFGLKHLILAIAGWLWEAPLETKRFSFAIQVNTLLLGMALVPANLFISYAPEETTGIMVFGGLALVLAVYLLRGLRGLDIGNGLLRKSPLLFLLYICAIEIAP
ncbi:MAG: DUF4271 domain-containing protein, partial [Bacteroidota bacterium]